MNVRDKMTLPPEVLNLLLKKEARNKLISIGVGVAASATGFVVDRALDKKLIEEFAPFVQNLVTPVTKN